MNEKERPLGDMYREMQRKANDLASKKDLTDYEKGLINHVLDRLEREFRERIENYKELSETDEGIATIDEATRQVFVSDHKTFAAYREVINTYPQNYINQYLYDMGRIADRFTKYHFRQFEKERAEELKQLAKKRKWWKF